MIQSPMTPTRRSLFRAGAGLAVAATATPFLTPGSAQAEDARQAGAEALNGNGFYRFKIGDFQATMISDGYPFSVPGYRTCRPTRHGIPLGSRPVGLAVIG
jgi:hypothetical protein